MKGKFLSFLLIIFSLSLFAQKQDTLIENEFYQILAGVHPQQDSFLVYQEDSSQFIQIVNHIIISNDAFFIGKDEEKSKTKFETRVFDYLSHFDSLIVIENEKIKQTKPIFISNSTLVNLKLNRFDLQHISFINCEIKNQINISNCSIDQINIESETASKNTNYPSYIFTNSQVNRLNFSVNYFKNFEIRGCEINFLTAAASKSKITGNFYEPSFQSKILIDSSLVNQSLNFYESQSENTLPQNLHIYYSIRNSKINRGSSDSQYFLNISLNDFSTISIDNSLFSSSIEGLPIELKGNCKDFIINNSQFEVSLVYNFSDVGHELSLENSIFNGVSFFRTTFPSNNFYVYSDWSILSENLQIIIPKKEIAEISNSSDSASYLPFVFDPQKNINEDSIALYNELIAIYQNWNHIYKSRGDRTSANRSYVEMREIETQKLKTDYYGRKKLKKLFQLRFNQILLYSSDYGSNPLLVLFNMLFVIIFFGFIFIIVPNEIDSSEAKPLGKVLLQVWFAFDQSLRAFLTFGKSDNAIPIARFIALIEGLFGWFLIVLLAVSLLYQALI